MDSRERSAPGDRPSVRQIYKVAAILCERVGEEFPETRAGASELIERLQSVNGEGQERGEPVQSGG
jgi:hypothetical protein